jgi:predicted nucleic-acid-binding protein
MNLSASAKVGLDTSFVLRLLTGEPAALTEKAIQQLDSLRMSAKTAVVSDLVLCETYFALQYHYGVPKQLALDKLAELLDSPEIISTGEARQVLHQSTLGKAKPGFVDRIIHAQYLRESEGMLTFEKSAAKLPHVTVL